MGTSPSPGLVVFRADASPEIGGGHVVRCLALAEHLRGRGWRCVLAVRAPTLATVPALENAGHPLVELCGEVHDEAQELGNGVGEHADWLVVDHYQRDASFEQTARAWARRLLAIDDRPARAHDCELLLDQTEGRAGREYEGRVSDGCRLLLGAHYALLRAQFASGRPAALARRGESRRIERVLVSFGATDRHGWALRALEGIRVAGLRVAVDVVLGHGSPHRAAVLDAAASSPSEVEVHEEARDMVSLMTRADLAIGAAGSTAWERCCLGLPSLVAVAADNQRDIASALERAGAAVIMGGSGTLDAEVVAEALAALARDGQRLAAMSAAAARVCDGRGAERVAGIMAGE